MPPTSQGTLIKVYRQDAGWSVRRLARESGLSAGFISQLEKGDRPVTRRVMGRIADALRIQPRRLLSEGGFIPVGHLQEAEDAARCALTNQELVARARGANLDEKLDWLAVDYLYLLGDDPYGKGWTFGPGGHEADWTPIAPERMAEADSNPRTSEIRQRRFPERYSAPKLAPTQIEGWDELSETDQRFVQQMVNKLRRPTAGE